MIKSLPFHAMLLAAMMVVSGFSVYDSYNDMGDVSGKFLEAGLLKYQSPSVSTASNGVIVPPRKPYPQMADIR